MGSAGKQGAQLFPSGVQVSSAVGQVVPQYGSGRSTNRSSLRKTGWPNRGTVSQQRSRVLMGWGGGSKVGKIGGDPEEGCLLRGCHSNAGEKGFIMAVSRFRISQLPLRTLGKKGRTNELARVLRL